MKWWRCFSETWFLLVFIGREKELRDKENAQHLYLNVKSEVESCMKYLKEKREKDPYRNILARLLYQMVHGLDAEVPTFEPWELRWSLAELDRSTFKSIVYIVSCIFVSHSYQFFFLSNSACQFDGNIQTIEVNKIQFTIFVPFCEFLLGKKLWGILQSLRYLNFTLKFLVLLDTFLRMIKLS